LYVRTAGVESTVDEVDALLPNDEEIVHRYGKLLYTFFPAVGERRLKVLLLAALQ